jgi:hypothetical protein
MLHMGSILAHELLTNCRSSFESEAQLAQVLPSMGEKQLVLPKKGQGK